MFNLKRMSIGLLAASRLALSQNAPEAHEKNPLSIAIPKTIEIGDADKIEPRHELYRVGEGVIPDATITYLNCGVSGKFLMQFKLNSLGSTPELDRAIEDAPAAEKDGAKDHGNGGKNGAVVRRQEAPAEFADPVEIGPDTDASFFSSPKPETHLVRLGPIEQSPDVGGDTDADGDSQGDGESPSDKHLPTALRSPKRIARLHQMFGRHKNHGGKHHKEKHHKEKHHKNSNPNKKKALPPARKRSIQRSRI